jgi:hypothetical protein
VGVYEATFGGRPEWVQLNGLAVALSLVRNSMAGETMSSRDEKWPRRSTVRVPIEKNSPTWFAERACRGGSWTTRAGWSANHVAVALEDASCGCPRPRGSPARERRSRRCPRGT